MGQGKRLGVLAVALSLLGACAARERRDGGPRLVLLLVADQFRADYLDRFAPQLEGGLRRLVDEGVVFDEAHQLHSATLTAPGHASLATGLYPSRHGVIANAWVDRQERKWVYSADDSDLPSPARLLGSTLGDWLKQTSGRSRCFAASAKDRSAVLLGGHRADGAFWFDTPDGVFESSVYYYPRREPDWLAEFNAEQQLEAHFGHVWTPLSTAEETRAELGIEAVDLGPLQPEFPHAFGGLELGPGRSFFSEIWGSPWLDLYLEQLAERVVHEERLGQRGSLDVLALGFSAMDGVGHRYGPDSLELFDTVRRLDLALSRLLDFVDREVGLERTVIGFSSDHGVAPVPELRRQHGLPGRRVGSEEILCLAQVGQRLSEKFGPERWLKTGPYLNPAAIEHSGVPRDLLERETASLVAACPGIDRVWTRSELLAGGATEDRRLELARNSYNAERSPDFLIETEEYFVPTRFSATTHGSPHRYDTHVPLIVWAPGLAPARIDRPVRAVDLAPTLAGLAGIDVPDGLDGEDLGPLLPRQPPSAGRE